MTSEKSEALALGLINLGLGILGGLWQGFLFGLILFIIAYIVFGLAVQSDSSDISIWNWFFDAIGLSLDSFKSKKD